MKYDITKEQLEYLKQFEVFFNSAINEGFSKPIATIHREKLAKIYTEITGIPYRINLSCPICTLELLKKIGKIYFENNKIKKVGRPKKL